MSCRLHIELDWSFRFSGLGSLTQAAQETRNEHAPFDRLGLLVVRVTNLGDTSNDDERGKLNADQLAIVAGSQNATLSCVCSTMGFARVCDVTNKRYAVRSSYLNSLSINNKNHSTT